MKRKIEKLLKELTEFKICKKEKGSIEIAHGKHKIFIPIKKFNPEHVFLEFDVCNIGNCSNLEHDLFSTYITRDGFILIAEIKSNKRKIKWIATA